MVNSVKYADFFCGLGAFHTAFKRYNEKHSVLKYECVLASDIDEGIRGVYEENYGIKPHGDINKMNIDDMPDFDILCAGFPCQPFSIAGNKKGFDDKEKGNLFHRLLEIIDKKQPRTLMLENVKNLHTINNGEVMSFIQSELENRGYSVSYRVIDSKFYNSPQSRHRIYIICDKHTTYDFKNIQNQIVPVSSIIDHSIQEHFDYTEKFDIVKCDSKKSMMKYKLINKLTGKGGRQGERVYGIDSYGPTICASSGGPGSKTGLYEVDGKIRKLSIKEGLLMFGFDSSYKFDTLGTKKQMLFYLGNSIVVNVLECLIEDLEI